MSEEDYETAPVKESAAPEATRKRLTEGELAAAREIYELGKQGIAEIAADLGVARQTLSRKFKEIGAVKGSRAHEVAQAARAAEMRYAVKRTEWIEELRVQGHSMLREARLIGRKIISDAVRSNRTLDTEDGSLRALGRYNKMLVDNINASLNLLDASNHIDDEDLPVLQIEDLTDERILEHHISTGVLPDDATLEDLNIEVFESGDVGEKKRRKGTKAAGK